MEFKRQDRFLPFSFAVCRPPKGDGLNRSGEDAVTRTPISIVSALFALSGMPAAEDRRLTLPEPPAMPKAAESGYAPVNGIEMYYCISLASLASLAKVDYALLINPQRLFQSQII